MTANVPPSRLSPGPADAAERLATAAPMVMAVPKGRILAEAIPLLRRAGIVPEPGFADEDDRRLRFATDDPALDLVRVRSFDVATFVAFGAAQIGICGADVLMEFDYSEIYAPVDLEIGHCRVSVAAPSETPGGDDPDRWSPRLSQVRVATKYPSLTRRHFASRGVQAEIVHLNGAMELAPGLGIARLIVDLVQTGSTLRANGLREIERIADVTSRLVVNRTAMKTDAERLMRLVARVRDAVGRDAGGLGAVGQNPPGPGGA